MMTDPIADMLTRLRNANQAFHDQATMPSSKIKVKIAEILKQEGYISEYSVHEPTEDEVGKTLTVTLKYGRNRERSLAGVRRSRSRAFACTRRPGFEILRIPTSERSRLRPYFSVTVSVLPTSSSVGSWMEYSLM